MAPDAKAQIKVEVLVVDDEPAIRMSLSRIFEFCGHTVRSTADGFSALREIRQGVPDILLSDLNMPGMSGFELLSVVRRRFPAIQVIAMSGAFSGHGIPPGVAADAFYEKGSSLRALLQMVEAMTRREWLPSPQHPSKFAPIWIPTNGHDPSGEAYVMITCPECLRTFPQVLAGPGSLICETGCVHCSSLIHYAIVQPMDSTPSEAFQRKAVAGVSMPPGVLDLNR